MAPKTSKLKEVAKSNEEKQKANWTMAHKKIFIDLALEQKRLGNRRSKSFEPEAWASIIKVFKEKTGLEYEYLQFKNLYDKLRSSWQAWQSLISKTGIGYDPDAKTFTMDNDRWDEMIKANPQYKKFRNKPLEFEEELDELFIGNSATGQAAWVPTSDAPPPSAGIGGSSTGSAYDVLVSDENDDVDSLKTTETTENEDDEVIKEIKKLRKRKMHKNQDNAKINRKGKMEGHIMQCMEGLTKVTELIISRNEHAQSQPLTTTHDPVKEALDILNNLEGVEVGDGFYLGALDVLEDPNKRELWLKMPSVARFGWMKRQLEKMGL